MEYEIKLDRSYYAKSDELLQWLIRHVGPGDGYCKAYNSTPPGQDLWKWEQQFGHTWIKFKREEDSVQFQLTWC